MFSKFLRSPTTLLALGLAVFIIFIGLFNVRLEEALRYDRQAILGGQAWRVLSAHLLHLSWGHLWMNVAGLLLVFLFFGNLLSRREWIICFLVAGIGTSLLTLVFVPSVERYVGLSGVLHGLFIAGGIRDFSVRRKEAIVFLAFITVKLIWEQFAGPLPGSEKTAGGPVLVDAHLFGAICGFITIMLLNWRK